MITRKEFYFVRHGQTQSNATGDKKEYGDELLNAVGVQQAHGIEPLIAKLPVTAICHSPLKRACQTKEIVTARLSVANYVVADLGECTLQIWTDMTRRGAGFTEHKEVHVTQFVEKVKKGLNEALSLHEGPPLIVAHGGVHWAICALMGISSDHDWLIDNCLPVHFYPDKEGSWKAKKLVS